MLPNATAGGLPAASIERPRRIATISSAHRDILLLATAAALAVRLTAE